MRTPRVGVALGLTLTEMVIASLIGFAVTLLLAQLIITGLAAFGRSRAFSTAAFLAAGVTERLLPVPGDSLPAIPPPLPSPFAAHYGRSVTVTPYDSQLDLILVTVTGPGGVKSVYPLLKRAVPEFAGVATDLFASRVTDDDAPARDVKYYDADAGSFGELLPPDFPPLPTVGVKEGRPAGVAQDQFGANVWIGDRANRRLYGSDARSASPTWDGVTAPTGPPLGVPTGMAADAYGDRIWVGDATNKGIRRYDPATDSWGGLVLLPAGGEPAGVATDTYNTVVYVADVVARTVRVYDTVTGTWSMSLAPTGGFSGPPRGVAVTGQGGWLWAADAASLWRYDGIAWSAFPLPPPLTTLPATVFGLATDQYGGMVWLHAKDNSLWLYDVAGNTFTQKR